MNAIAWVTSIAVIAALVAIPVVMLRTVLLLFGPNRRKSFAAAAVAIALLGLDRFIRPAQEHVQQANDGETDQDAIGTGFGRQEWLARRSAIRPDEMIVEDEES